MPCPYPLIRGPLLSRLVRRLGLVTLRQRFGYRSHGGLKPVALITGRFTEDLLPTFDALLVLVFF
jgi:hypothetical protein